MVDYFPKFRAHGKAPLKAKKLFYDRLYYRYTTDEIFNFIDNDNYIDLWYDVPYYGKVNEQGVLYAPDKDKIVYSAANNIASFPFVISAYEDMVFLLRRTAVQQGSMLRTLFKDFKVEKSFYDSVDEYIAYSYAAVDSFNEYILTQGLMVVDYPTYVCEFIKYVKLNNAIFSYYSIFASSRTPINASGLALELADLNHDDDATKNAFFEHPEFSKYVNIAAKFGFRVNKNAPWMLIADLNSKPMQEGFEIKRYTQSVSFPGVPSKPPTTTRYIDGYLAQSFIPNTSALFENNFMRVSTRALLLFKQTMLHGYVKFQRDVEYLIDYLNPGIVTHPTFRTITDSRIIPASRLTRYIKTYKSVKSKNPGTGTVEKSDLNLNFDLSFYFKHFEKILEHEFDILKNRSYRRFKTRYNNKIKRKEWGDALRLIEKFYNSTRIFNPNTGKPAWSSPISKKNLTSKIHNNMIPNERKKPTVTRTVTEFNTGY